MPRPRMTRRFKPSWHSLLHDYCGRPTPLYFTPSGMTEMLGGAKVYLKREDLLHTGAHKINNALGQASAGAGAWASSASSPKRARASMAWPPLRYVRCLGLECVVYMGEEDMRRQELNVYRMRLLGAEVRGVASGSATLKDAINEAMRDWVTNVRDDVLHPGLGAGERTRTRRWCATFIA